MSGIRHTVGLRKRILLKTVGYRVASIVLTVAIAFALLQDMSDAVNVGILANVAKMGLYYAHERFWDQIEWGQSG